MTDYGYVEVTVNDYGYVEVTLNDVENVQVSLTKIEIWKVIRSNHRYEISSFGRVRNARTKRILKPYANSRKNLQVKLYTGTIQKNHVNHYVHRLVAEHFLYDYQDHLRIIHKDDDKNNCRVENLTQEQHTKSARWVWDEEGRKRRVQA